jgi:VanZ family protein
MRRFALWAPPVIYMAAIFFVSAQSHPMPEVTERVWDKLLHFVEYGGLAVLWYRAFAGEGMTSVMAALLALAATSLYAASDEVHQAFVPERMSDVRDWISDTIGAAIAVSLCVVARLTRVSTASRRPRRLRR